MFRTFLAPFVARGFSPSLIFDIGAYEGEFLDFCGDQFPSADRWAFEPNIAKGELLSRKADRVFTEVLAEKSDELTYWEAEIPIQTGNSIFREHTNVGFRATTRRAVGIDSLVEGRVPQLVKLDTQGSELAILKGGLHSICQADIVITEVQVRRYNESAPLFFEVMSFMEAQDYILVDIADALRVSGILIQSDAVFVRRSSPFCSENARLEFAF